MTKPQTLTELREGWANSPTLAHKRRLLIDGATFASFTIRTQTETAETDFARWVSANRPNDLTNVLSGHLRSSRAKRLLAVRALSIEDVATLEQVPTRQREELFANLVWGYGAAKASFALACAGIGREGCIDGLLARKHADKLAPLGWSLSKAPSAVERKTAIGWALYWRAVDLIWPNTNDHAAAQWSEWLADRTNQNRDITHSLLTR